MPAIASPCCCTFCCRELTCKSQGRSVSFPSDQFFPLALASSSRSQLAVRTASAAAYLTWERPYVSVRWRPPLSVAIVTHLVTQSLGKSATELGTATFCHSRLRRRLVHSDATVRPLCAAGAAGQAGQLFGGLQDPFPIVPLYKAASLIFESLMDLLLS